MRIMTYLMQTLAVIFGGGALLLMILTIATHSRLAPVLIPMQLGIIGFNVVIFLVQIKIRAGQP